MIKELAWLKIDLSLINPVVNRVWRTVNGITDHFRGPT
ncbi:hypothetical protein AC564_0198 [Lacticaseibacillus paracasei]|nr:hypothetical protein AC564_0198 [Lacticaseibacillus paracasei]